MRPRISSHLSDHEVQNMCLHLTRLSMIRNDRAAPVKGSGKVCSFYKKNYILIKPRKQASIWLSLGWWLHKPQNITAHYIYSRVNMYNQFQLRMFKFVFVLQVIVGPLAVVSCDILCLLFIQKTKTVNCCAWLTKHHKKAKEYSMNMQLHENSVRLWNASKVFVYKYINIKKTTVCC